MSVLEQFKFWLKALVLMHWNGHWTMANFRVNVQFKTHQQTKTLKRFYLKVMRGSLKRLFIILFVSENVMHFVNVLSIVESSELISIETYFHWNWITFMRSTLLHQEIRESRDVTEKIHIESEIGTHNLRLRHKFVRSINLKQNQYFCFNSASEKEQRILIRTKICVAARHFEAPRSDGIPSKSSKNSFHFVSRTHLAIWTEENIKFRPTY